LIFGVNVFLFSGLLNVFDWVKANMTNGYALAETQSYGQTETEDRKREREIARGRDSGY